MVPLKWVDATDLVRWADRLDARARLPQLLRLLIHATVQQPRRVGFPSGESIQMGGWDGIVEAPEGNNFVANGYSVWELGVNQDVKGKADDDYDKRVKNPLGVVNLKPPLFSSLPDDGVIKISGRGTRRVRGYGLMYGLMMLMT